MAPTEFRSRDEWLVEVRRRGERIRRRRRFGAALVGVLALVLPVSALATFLGDDGPRSVELTAAGPAPTGQASTAPDGPVPEPGVAAATATTSLPATGGGLAAAGGREAPTTTAEVHGRVATVNGSTTPPTTSTPTLTPTTAPTTTVPSIDDPVVRPPAGTTATTGRSGSTATADTTIPPADVPLVACPATDIRVAASTEKASYAPGETVRGSATIENRSTSTCLLPTFSWVEILNTAGEDVFQSSSGNGYAADPRGAGGPSVKAEPGAIFTATFHWVAGNCAVPAATSGSECPGRFPPGTYTAVVHWGDYGGPIARTTFQLSG